MEGQPNRQVRELVRCQSSLGRHFSFVHFRTMRFSVSGWRRFPHCPAACRVGVKSSRKAVENPARASFEPNVIMRPVCDHGFTIVNVGGFPIMHLQL